MSLDIAIRVDASSQIGTGHFMRCLTLANALKQRGSRVRFVSRHLPVYLRRMVAEKEHESVLLGSTSSDTVKGDLAHAQWLDASQHTDAQDTLYALSNLKWDWLIVDHYALDIRWESELRDAAKWIFVIDDLADRIHDCEVLLDQNFYADMHNRYDGKVPSHCKLMLGPRYALLRDEFRQQREHVKIRSGPVRRILVVLGGVDEGNYTGKAMDALVNLADGSMVVDVVIGDQHPHHSAIESTCKAYGFNCYIQTDKLGQLMAGADLAIGAGGATTWERCCLGLPTLTICVAENQRQLVIDSAAEGLLIAPDIEMQTPYDIERNVRFLIENSGLRHAISSKAMQIVDGRGLLRVMQSFGHTDIVMREARQDDSRALYEWRNHPSIRAVSRRREEIDWATHQSWLKAVISAPDRFLLVGQRDGEPVGVVRFDIEGNEAEVSIYLVPCDMEPGMGSSLLRAAEFWIADRRPDLRVIKAHVRAENEHSRRLFWGCDYQFRSVCYSKNLHRQ